MFMINRFFFFISLSFFFLLYVAIHSVQVEAQMVPGLFLGISHGPENGAVKSKVASALAQEVEFVVLSNYTMNELMNLEKEEFCDDYDAIMKYGPEASGKNELKFKEQFRKYVPGYYRIFQKGKFVILIHKKSSSVPDTGELKGLDALSFPDGKNIPLNEKDLNDLFQFIKQEQLINAPIYVFGHGTDDGSDLSFEEYYKIELIMLNSNKEMTEQEREKKLQVMRENYVKRGTTAGLSDKVFVSFMQELVQAKSKINVYSPIHVDSCEPHHAESKVCFKGCPIMIIRPGKIKTPIASCARSFNGIFGQLTSMSLNINEVLGHVERKDTQKLGTLLNLFKESFNSPIQVYANGNHLEVESANLREIQVPRAITWEDDSFEEGGPEDFESLEMEFQAKTTPNERIEYLDSLSTKEKENDRYNLLYTLPIEERKEILEILRLRNNQKSFDDFIKRYFNANRESDLLQE